MIRSDHPFAIHKKDLPTHMKYKGRDHELIRPNPDIMFTYAENYLDNGVIAT
jgi:hypothetical protein